MRYLLTFLFTIGLAILAVVLVVSSIHGTSTTTTVGQVLTNYAYTGTQVEMTIDGPINADQDHYELQMTVGSSSSELTVQQGYQGTTIQSKTYTNNSAAYTEFLAALQLAGFNKGLTGKDVNTNPNGYCAFGERYTYQIINPVGNNAENFWSTSCGGQGTFKGDPGTVLSLFIAQMPDYDTLIGNTDLQS